MCGINGFVQFKNRYAPETMKSIVHSMNERIIHRGPDSEGLYSDESCALGMRRLAIIDLKTGRQPIWNEAHTMMIVFNGEIYNYLELKKELAAKGCVFHTNTDTEVILKGYESCGCAFFPRLEGMFAFCIYEADKKQWTFARDRIGEKPLYYYCTEDHFVFGSELKSLLSTGLVPKEIDSQCLSQYFQLTYIPAPGCIIKGVKKLMPATYMVLKASGELTARPYWELNIEDRAEYLDYSRCKVLLRDALFRSVEKRMISDVPLGAFLSGGIDSTITVGIMSAISQKPIDTFTIGFKDKAFDESGLARLVAAKNHTNHHEIVADWDEIFADMDAVLDNIDEPFADPSLVVTYTVSRLTSQYVKVALTGDAGDELFAGYDKYLIAYYSNLYNKVPRILRKGLIEPAVRCLPADSYLARKVNKVLRAAGKDPYQQRKELLTLGFSAEEARSLLPGLQVDEMPFIKAYYDTLAMKEEQTRAQYVDLKVLLEGDMLAKVDRAGMLASLETRVPMLDGKVVELAFNMPARFKLRGAKKKLILKEAFADMIPAELYRAPKHGFNAPVGKWLRKELKPQLTAFMDPDFLAGQGLFDRDHIDAIAEKHMNGEANMERQLWAFFVFQYWYKNAFDTRADLTGGGYPLNKSYTCIIVVLCLLWRVPDRQRPYSAPLRNRKAA